MIIEPEVTFDSNIEVSNNIPPCETFSGFISLASNESNYLIYCKHKIYIIKSDEVLLNILKSCKVVCWDLLHSEMNKSLCDYVCIDVCLIAKILHEKFENLVELTSQYFDVVKGDIYEPYYIYLLLSAYYVNGALNFVINSHDIDLSTIKRYILNNISPSIDEKKFLLEKEKVLEKISSINKKYSMDGAYVNLNSYSDLDALLRKFKICQSKYSHKSRHRPFNVEVLYNTRDKYNVIEDIIEVKDLSSYLKHLDKLHNSHKILLDYTQINNLYNITLSDNITNRHDGELFSIMDYGKRNLLKINIIEPELYTLVKWSGSNEYSEVYENGGSLIDKFSEYFDIDVVVLSEYLDELFSNNIIEREKFVANKLNIDRKRIFGMSKVIPELNSFYERVSQYAVNNHYIKNFWGRVSFFTRTNLDLFFKTSLYTITRLTSQDSLKMILDLFDSSKYKLLYSNYNEIRFIVDNFDPEEISSILSKCYDITYPFNYRYKFTYSV